MGGLGDIVRNHSVLSRLLIANCAVFVLMTVFAILNKCGIGTGDMPVMLLALAAPTDVWIHYPWTLFTYMFTHENFFHILFNMLWLLWFGHMFMERGNARSLLRLYIGGGIGGGVLYMALYPLLPGLYGSLPLLMGASASVMALMSATAVLMPDYPLHLFFIGDVKLKWMALAMIVLAFIGLGGGNAAGGIAHAGGVVTGICAGMWMKRNPATAKSKIRKRRNPLKGMSESERRTLKQAGMHNAAARERENAHRLDELLDKIHVSGFNSLTKAERMELEDLSRKVTK